MPRLVPFAQVICHNRNRDYAPQLGRFLQQDPRGTAAIVLGSASLDARSISAIVAAFDLAELHGDGGNLYEYLGSNPWQRSDVTGLSWDAFSIVDDYLAEDAGSKSAFFERIIGGAKTAAYVPAVLASQLPFPIGSIAGDLAADALEGGMPPQLIAARKILGYANLAILTVTIAKIGITAVKAAMEYVVKHGARAVWNFIKRYNVISLARRAIRAIRGCGCFAAGTKVWTMRGMVPIEEIVVNDVVVSRDEGTGGLSFRRVVETMVRPTAAIVLVSFIAAGARAETLETTEDHPFWVDGRGWVEVGGLQPGDRVRTVAGTMQAVESIGYTNRLSTVYNFEVEGIHDYHVGTDGILVHNGIKACWLWAENHLIPVYMGGARRTGTTVTMYERDHVLLHQLIDNAADQLGVPFKNEGTQVMKSYIQTNGAQGVLNVKQALIEGYTEFDRQKGTTLLQDLLAEFKNQGWP
jgi:hypothetical protein